MPLKQHPDIMIRERMNDTQTPIGLEDCVKTHCASTVTLYMSTLSNPNSLTLPLTTNSLPNMTLKSLVDSGSSNSFIDSAFVKTRHLPAYGIPPIRLILIDGTSNSIISQALDLQLCFPTGESQKLTLFVTPLDQSCMIVLGYYWLTCYNPSIDWALGSISFQQSAQHKSLGSPPIKTFPSAAPTSKPPDPVLEIMKPTSPVEPRKTLRVTLINAAAYSCASKLEGSKCFQLWISHPEVTSQSTTTMEKMVDMNNIPKEYHNFADVFSKSKAGKLAEH